MNGIITASGNYFVPSGTIFDEDVSTWTLVKYIFKWMLAFLIVNAILTAPFVVLALYIATVLTGHDFRPRGGN
jgi:hypothetical protein